MASSSYYYSQMLQYSRSKRTMQTKKEKYDGYLKKLQNVERWIPELNTTITNANNNLLGGGYLIGEGVSLDNGELKETINKIETTEESIKGVITKVEAKITEMTNEINRLGNLYNEANENYKRAKREEMM